MKHLLINAQRRKRRRAVRPRQLELDEANKKREQAKKNAPDDGWKGCVCVETDLYDQPALQEDEDEETNDGSDKSSGWHDRNALMLGVRSQSKYRARQLENNGG